MSNLFIQDVPPGQPENAEGSMRRSEKMRAVAGASRARLELVRGLPFHTRRKVKLSSSLKMTPDISKKGHS
jgi:hypothetical protein